MVNRSLLKAKARSYLVLANRTRKASRRRRFLAIAQELQLWAEKSGGR